MKQIMYMAVFETKFIGYLERGEKHNLNQKEMCQVI